MAVLYNTWVKVDQDEPPIEIKRNTVTVDLSIKMWDPATDKFFSKRLVDCHWDYGSKRFVTKNGNPVDDGRPTHFMWIQLPTHDIVYAPPNLKDDF